MKTKRTFVLTITEIAWPCIEEERLGKHNLHGAYQIKAWGDIYLTRLCESMAERVGGLIAKG